MTLPEMLAILGAGFGAGVINAVAGGGTLLSFPVLVWAGRDPIVANATNALALWPGSLAGALGFRREMAQARGRLGLMLPSALVGGALGAALLLRTPTSVFSSLVPWLILGATVLMAVQRPLSAAMARRAPADANAPVTATSGRTVGLILGQLAISVYGGYFGAGMGILMLAVLGLCGVSDIHERNGLKNVAATVINGIAGVYFALSGAIAWLDAAVLAAGAIAGGFAGAAGGKKLGRRGVEVLVVVIGLGMSVLLFVKR